MSTTTTTGRDPVTGEPVRTTTVHDGGHPLNALAGRHDAAATAAAGGALTARELQREIDAAYQRGRDDQRRAQRSNPLLTILVVLLAVLGGAVIFLAIQNRGFSGAGAVLDRSASQAADEVREGTVQARDAAGETAQDAGAAIQGAGASVEREAEASASSQP